MSEEKIDATAIKRIIKELKIEEEDQRNTPRKMADRVPMEVKLILKAVMTAFNRIATRQNGFANDRIRTILLLEQMAQATDIVTTFAEQLSLITQDPELKTLSENTGQALTERCRASMQWCMNQPDRVVEEVKQQ